ncbi:transglycosylase SLT domain-containing protein [Acidithiobacillus ferrivorans]|uniref:Transglycosylase SLT domain-containing protein n=2 Tax=Acidithiobacillus ferrivorans TaxID=160808 RepID=A0A7T4WH13_9PROT|nr:transglycosylase SLT domain-containing protein [Acidithiobacillus ferrivorans]
MTEASTAYHVPVTAIERVVTAAKGQGGIGPMGIPKQWLPVLGVYGFSVATLRKSPCWGVAAGAWILAVETMYAHPNKQITDSTAYPTHIGAIPQQDVRWANAAAAENHIPAPLLLAVAAQESGFNADAVSPKGAQGLMQFMPGTWARYGVLADGRLGSPFNPKEALFAGAAYLRHLALKLGSWPLAIAGYNAGGQAVINAGYRIPPFQETQNYVPAVLAHYRQIIGGQP